MAGENILIVDDEEYVLSLLRMYLERMGYRCDTATDGKLCLERLADGDAFDVVLLDLHMPVMGGLEVLERVRHTHPDLSVIVISASKDAEDVKRAMSLGAYDYLFKPFDGKTVETVIRRAVERARLIRQNRDYQLNLEKKVVEQTRELFSLYTDLLQSLILTLDLREKETGYHSFRVTEYAITLAEKMGLDGDSIIEIAKGALLHDIGKIGIPDSILLKPAPLSPEEWRVMKKHPLMGYELIKSIKFLGAASDLILYHHERYDGTGYPFGLKGKEIPLGARIFSVADTLDALTSERNYKKSISFEEAVKIIESGAGTQFDPDIVSVFLSIPIEVWENIKRQISRCGESYLRRLLYKIINREKVPT